MLIMNEVYVRMNENPLMSVPLSYRKSLYQDVFEYDLPMVSPAAKVYEFVHLEDCTEHNPWKESFKLLVS